MTIRITMTILSIEAIFSITKAELVNNSVISNMLEHEKVVSVIRSAISEKSILFQSEYKIPANIS